MRKTICIFTFLMCTFCLHAQKDFGFGVYAGGNISRNFTEEVDGFSTSVSFKGCLQGGAFFYAKTSDKTQLHVSLGLVEKGCTSKSSFSGGGISFSSESNVSRLYFQLGTTERFYIAHRFFIDAGVYMAIGWKSRSNSNDLLLDNYERDKSEKRFDLGPMLGFGYDIGKHFAIVADVSLSALSIHPTMADRNFSVATSFEYKF